MNDFPGYAAATMFRIIAVLAIVRYWANSRYRADVSLPDSSEYETDPVARSEKRARQRSRSVRLLLTWVVGALIVWLSGLPMIASRPSRFDPSYWGGFGVAVVFLSVIFFAAEWAATSSFRTFLNIVGWVCAFFVSLVYCGAVVDPSNVLGRICQVLLVEPRVWTLLIAYFVVLFPAGNMIGRFMDRWAGQLPPDQGLPGAGQWIGRLERFLILSRLLAAQPTGIAVLVTAKGVLRFGEIRNDADPNNQRRLVEYILVGTMMSYAVALSVGWITLHLRVDVVKRNDTDERACHMLGRCLSFVSHTENLKRLLDINICFDHDGRRSVVVRAHETSVTFFVDPSYESFWLVYCCGWSLLREWSSFRLELFHEQQQGMALCEAFGAQGRQSVLCSARRSDNGSWRLANAGNY